MKTTCECCGKKIDDNTADCDEEGKVYCSKCASEFEQPCAVCGKLEPLYNMAYVDDNGNPFCGACA